MHDDHRFLLYAVIFLAATVFAVPLSKRAQLGAVLGYLVAGVVIGPQALGLVADAELVLTFSEIGVVMLLFLLGLELSPQRLWLMRRLLLGLGATQMGLVTALLAVAGLALGLPLAAALIAAFGLALSSTAFGVQILSERSELTSEHGRGAFGVFLFQDLVAVPALALIPLLAAGEVQSAARPAWQSVGLVIGSILAVVVAGRWLLRPLFRIVANTGLVEVFTATSLLVVLGTALLMQQAGLSMGLGAFLAGVLLADSEYRHELESHIEPFKGLLLGLFFMGVGMALDLRLLAALPLVVAALVVGVLGLQVTVMWAVGRAFRYSQRASLLLAALLASGGEFAFVVFATAEQARLLEPRLAGLLNLVVALSMALTPLLVLGLAALADRRAAQAAPKRPYDELPGERVDVVIAGFGRVGQIPGRLLAAQRIPYTVIEPSSEQVDFSRRFGNKLYYGDPARPEILRAARVGEAKVFVLALDDPEHSLRVARVLRRLYPQVRVLARARNRQHAFKLMDLGVEDIIRETLLSSLEIARRTLTGIGMSAAEAAERAERFHEFDERLLVEQHLVYDDESALVQSSEDARRELLALFEADTAGDRADASR
ncbi:MAG: cation:proton antiporter [Xanthomonadales bacterium]|nr:Glutathione-regulated potassium-efflux system protein KefC [Xanthomonadales bacterium]MCC6593521.1 cation:proton antiporter [Xanthomonadales bacterium]MCE7932354.1 glutathione-regulated potassium-efflux system protein KefB [Xanthomonadales bacterium PRO6]